ncbi:MAG: hypothetical protein LBG48_04645, partial [Rickettsiales bacterium]|nr:hypothetical protein [Rickettsiales bacterium]
MEYGIPRSKRIVFLSERRFEQIDRLEDPKKLVELGEEWERRSDYEGAIRCYKKASLKETENPTMSDYNGHYNYGRCLKECIGVEEEDEERKLAYRELQLAALSGHVQSKFLLGQYWLAEENPNFALAAARYVKEVADLGYAEAQYLYAKYLKEGVDIEKDGQKYVIIEKNEEESMIYFQAAARKITSRASGTSVHYGDFVREFDSVSVEEKRMVLDLYLQNSLTFVGNLDYYEPEAKEYELNVNPILYNNIFVDSLTEGVRTKKVLRYRQDSSRDNRDNRDNREGEGVTYPDLLREVRRECSDGGIDEVTDTEGELRTLVSALMGTGVGIWLRDPEYLAYDIKNRRWLNEMPTDVDGKDIVIVPNIMQNPEYKGQFFHKGDIIDRGLFGFESLLLMELVQLKRSRDGKISLDENGQASVVEENKVCCCIGNHESSLEIDGGNMQFPEYQQVFKRMLLNKTITTGRIVEKNGVPVLISHAALTKKCLPKILQYVQEAHKKESTSTILVKEMLEQNIFSDLGIIIDPKKEFDGEQSQELIKQASLVLSNLGDKTPAILWQKLKIAIGNTCMLDAMHEDDGEGRCFYGD